MKGIQIPPGWQVEILSKTHNRRLFSCGADEVDSWLKTKALQHQRKHLSVTKLLLSNECAIAGFYTLAMGQVDFSDLPTELAKSLPRRCLPVAVLAWLGVASKYQGQQLSTCLLASALRDCYQARATFPFVAVILDCLSEKAKTFYLRYDFATLPGHANRLFLSAATLRAMMESS